MRRFLGCMLTASAIGASPVWLAAQDEPKKPEAKPVDAKQGLFAQLDKNSDGQITPDEVPEEKKSYFERILKNNDKNGDGKINAEE